MTTQPTAHGSQLGLDFDGAAPTPHPAPPAPPPAAKNKATPSAQPGSAPFEAWSSGHAVKAGSGGLDALAMACAIQDPVIAAALLALPIDWAVNAEHGFTMTHQRGERSMTPLAHLVDGRRTHQWGRQEQSPSMDDIGRTALALVARGANFLSMDSTDQCPLTLCALAGRSEVIAALAGHPDFTFEKLRNLRIGSRMQREDGDSAIDTRRPLLGHLISSCQTKAVEALIQSAGFSPNFQDGDGKLPLSYAPNIDSVESLIAMGAQPGLADADGRNALAHAQKVQDTSMRERMITRIATELKKGAKSDPSIMAKLQSENIAALLEAAQKSPKTSLLKTISAFKFDVANVRDPKTLTTPLMAALSGGRMASADHLIRAGCRLDDVDAKGVPASAYLLANFGTSNGPKPTDLANDYGSKIDLSIRSKRGWPAMLEAAFWQAKDSMGLSGYNHNAADCFKAVLSEQGLRAADPSWLLADDGTTAMEAYASGKSSTYRSSDAILSLFALSEAAGCAGAFDGAIRAALLLAGNGADLLSKYGSNSAGSILNELEKRCEAKPCGLIPRAAEALSSNPELAKIFVKGHWPILRASIESTEISMATPGRGSSASTTRARL